MESEITTHDIHKLVDLSTSFLYIYVVLVFEEWVQKSELVRTEL